MGRIIIGESKPASPDAQATEVEKKPASQKADTYLERVAKYIPAEVVAFFVFVNSLLGEIAKSENANVANAKTSTEISKALEAVTMANGSLSVMTVAKLMLLLGAAMSVVYLFTQRDPAKDDEYLGLHAVVSAVGFFVWAYAVDAVAFRPIHDGVLASILLASYSLVSGAITPAAQDTIINMMMRKKPVEEAPNTE